MAYGDAFRYSMQPPGGGMWYYWQGATVLQSSVPVYNEVPLNWQDTGISWKRSSDRRGLIRSVAKPFEYVDNAARILRHFNYNGSIQDVVIFTIEKLNLDTGQYELYFSGQVDLSTTTDGEKFVGKSLSLSASVIEGGVGAMIDAAGTSQYSITLNPNDADLIYIDGVRLRDTYTYVISDSGGTISGIGQGMLSVQSPFVIREGNFNNGTAQTQQGFNFGGYSNPDLGGASGTPPIGGSPVDYAFSNYLFSASQAMTAKVIVSQPALFYHNTSSGSQDIQFTIEALVVPGSAASPYAFSQRFVIYQDSILSPGGNRTLPNLAVTTSAFTMNAGDRVYLVYYFFKTGGSGAATYDFSFPEGSMSLETDFTPPATTTYSYRYAVLIEKLLFQITGQTGILQSDFFTNQNARYNDCNPYNVRLTCGDALRNLTTNAAGVSQTPAIRISWVDLWNDMRRRFGLGMDIRNGKVVIERAAFFFDQNSIIADVGEVSDMKTGWATEYFTTSAKWGYPAQTYDQLNGRDEPNTTSHFKYPLTFLRAQGTSSSTGSDEDNTCPIRSDMYGVEGARNNLSQKKTTDAKTDNDVFAIETEQNTTQITAGVTVYLFGVPVSTIGALTAYKLYRPQNAYAQPAVTGLLFPATAYNLTQTPMRCLLRSGDTIRGGLYHLDSSYITFQTGDKNTFVNVNCGSGPIAENADIRVSDLDAPYMKPRVSHITCILPTTFAAALERNRSGCIQYSQNGAIFKGFPMEVMVKGATDNSYNITVLWTTDTDETPLMNA